MNTIYKNQTAVIYLRLSKDDRGDESMSIGNQRSILTSFCVDHGIRITKEFVDDGRSGGNFDRPGFQKMIEFVKKNKVDIVITKDLSRLGRDMTESSMYAERFFTELGIRYLAISDNFDSFEDNIYAPFQFAMNDVYIRDASKKIKTVLSHKRNKGEYCCCPPFGYKKSERNKSQLVPDEETAPIVKMIFDYAAQGKGAMYIANKLTSMGVITPLKYRVLYRDEFSEDGASHATDLWCYTTVRRIIRNRVYLGHTLLGKQKKISPKTTKKVEIPEKDWIITENTHEPLVSEETFIKANNTLDFRAEKIKEMTAQPKRVNMLRGLTFCANCGSPLSSGGSAYKGEWEKYWYLVCTRSPKSKPKHCEHGARISYHHLLKIIKDELNSFIQLTNEEIDMIINELRENHDFAEHNKEIKVQCDALIKEIENSDKIIAKLYSDNINGKLSDERLASMVENIEIKTAEQKATIKNLESQYKSSSEADNYEEFLKIAKQYTYIEELTPEIVRAFIDRIEVGEQSAKHKKKVKVTQDIKIYYKFIGKHEFTASKNVETENSQQTTKSV